jgi:hypothetical protein
MASSATTIWWTEGAVTPKKRCMSASDGGRRLMTEYARMNARYCPWSGVKRGVAAVIDGAQLIW